MQLASFFAPNRNKPRTPFDVLMNLNTLCAFFRLEPNKSTKATVSGSEKPHSQSFLCVTLRLIRMIKRIRVRQPLPALVLFLNQTYPQLMGLAVYNCITLDIRLPIVCYRKLLSSVPKPGSCVSHPADQMPGPSLRCKSSGCGSALRSETPCPQPVGVVPVTLEDYRSVDPVRYVFVILAMIFPYRQ